MPLNPQEISDAVNSLFLLWVNKNYDQNFPDNNPVGILYELDDAFEAYAWGSKIESITFENGKPFHEWLAKKIDPPEEYEIRLESFNITQKASLQTAAPVENLSVRGTIRIFDCMPGWKIPGPLDYKVTILFSGVPKYKTIGYHPSRNSMLSQPEG